MNIFSKLEHITDLTDNEKIFVDFIKEHTEQFITMSASDIGTTCFISTSTIYRLCQKLEVTGLSQLKVLVSSSLNAYLQEQKELDYNYPVKEYQTQYQITEKLKEVYHQTVITTQNLMDLEQLRHIASALKKANHIDIYTSAGNIYFAENFKFQMQEIGILVNVPLEDYQQRLAATISDETHLAIIISFEGRGHQIGNIASILKKVKTPIVLISSTSTTSIRGYATYQLYLCPYEDHYQKISSFATRMSLLYLLDCIYTCYFELDYQKHIDYKINAYKRMNEANKQ